MLAAAEDVVQRVADLEADFDGPLSHLLSRTIKELQGEDAACCSIAEDWTLRVQNASERLSRAIESHRDAGSDPDARLHIELARTAQSVTRTKNVTAIEPEEISRLMGRLQGVMTIETANLVQELVLFRCEHKCGTPNGTNDRNAHYKTPVAANSVCVRRFLEHHLSMLEERNNNAILTTLGDVPMQIRGIYEVRGASCADGSPASLIVLDCEEMIIPSLRVRRNPFYRARVGPQARDFHGGYQVVARRTVEDPRVSRAVFLYEFKCRVTLIPFTENDSRVRAMDLFYVIDPGAHNK